MLVGQKVEYRYFPEAHWSAGVILSIIKTGRDQVQAECWPLAGGRVSVVFVQDSCLRKV